MNVRTREFTKESSKDGGSDYAPSAAPPELSPVFHPNSLITKGQVDLLKERVKRWTSYIDWTAIKKIWHWLLFTVTFAAVPTLIARALNFLEKSPTNVDPAVNSSVIEVNFNWYALLGNGHLFPMVAAISMTVISEGIQTKKLGSNSIVTILIVLMSMILYAHVAGGDSPRYDQNQIAILSLFAWFLSVISGVPSLYLYWSAKNV